MNASSALPTDKSAGSAPMDMACPPIAATALTAVSCRAKPIVRMDPMQTLASGMVTNA